MRRPATLHSVAGPRVRHHPTDLSAPGTSTRKNSTWPPSSDARSRMLRGPQSATATLVLRHADTVVDHHERDHIISTSSDTVLVASACFATFIKASAAPPAAASPVPARCWRECRRGARSGDDQETAASLMLARSAASRPLSSCAAMQREDDAANLADRLIILSTTSDTARGCWADSSMPADANRRNRRWITLSWNPPACNTNEPSTYINAKQRVRALDASGGCGQESAGKLEFLRAFAGSSALELTAATARSRDMTLERMRRRASRAEPCP